MPKLNLIFATNNFHKVNELQMLLPKHITISTLTDVGFTEDIEETATTFRGNSRIKVERLWDEFQQPAIGEDSGLVVPSLNGEPGVYSARYAGELSDDGKNNALLLQNMQGKKLRAAYYISVIALKLDAQDIHYFEGKVLGVIAEQPKGDGGFGYDPLFIPETYSKTFAELGSDVKKKISHRARSTNQLVEYLQALK